MDLPQPPSFNLTGKRALVTGASSGIGLGCAVAFAQAGAHVVCVARRPAPLQKAVDAMAGKGWSVEARALDQCDLSAVAGLFDDPFDILLNAAGTGRHSPALDTRPEDFDAVVNVNLRSAYFLSAQAARALMEAGRPGSIIHIGSQMGHVGGPERAVYCATKHALEGMVKAMAIEWGPSDIRINTICPTFVRTPLTEGTFEDPERMAWVMDRIKLPRTAEVGDISGAALYLASDAARMVTGTALMVDGGWTAE
ncbi:SDR family oxidoreductase [Sulfitobacter sp. LCG007]